MKFVLVIFVVVIASTNGCYIQDCANGYDWEKRSKSNDDPRYPHNKAPSVLVNLEEEYQQVTCILLLTVCLYDVLLGNRAGLLQKLKCLQFRVIYSLWYLVKTVKIYGISVTRNNSILLFFKWKKKKTKINFKNWIYVPKQLKLNLNKKSKLSQKNEI